MQKLHFSSARDSKPYVDIHVDLFSNSPEKMIFYEMKSIDSQGINLIAQVRRLSPNYTNIDTFIRNPPPS